MDTLNTSLAGYRRALDFEMQCRMGLCLDEELVELIGGDTQIAQWHNDGVDVYDAVSSIDFDEPQFSYLFTGF